LKLLKYSLDLELSGGNRRKKKPAKGDERPYWKKACLTSEQGWKRMIGRKLFLKYPNRNGSKEENRDAHRVTMVRQKRAYPLSCKVLRCPKSEIGDSSRKKGNGEHLREVIPGGGEHYCRRPGYRHHENEERGRLVGFVWYYYSPRSGCN